MRPKNLNIALVCREGRESNQKTMVACSHILQDILSGRYQFRLPWTYKLSATGPSREFGYFLADGIYPSWPIFVLPIHATEIARENTYYKSKEEQRKAIERNFGLLQARFKTLRHEDHRCFKGEIF